VKPARQYQPQGSVTVGLLAFWHPQPATTNVESCDKQVRTRAPGSEPGRLGARAHMLSLSVFLSFLLSLAFSRARARALSLSLSLPLSFSEFLCLSLLFLFRFPSLFKNLSLSLSLAL